MGISRIGILFAANVDSPRRSSPREENREANRAAEANRNDDAAVVSRSRYSTNPAEDPERAARVQQLKNQVRRGQYNVSSAKIALSVYRDIM